jgi:hypothetical protein
MTHFISTLNGIKLVPRNRLFNLSVHLNVTKIQEVLGRTNRLLSFNKTRIAYKTTPPTILRCRGKVFTELLPSNDRGVHRQTHRHTHPTTLPLLRVLVATESCLSSRFLAMKGRIHFAEPSPINNRKDTRTDTQTDRREL